MRNLPEVYAHWQETRQSPNGREFIFEGFQGIFLDFDRYVSYFHLHSNLKQLTAEQAEDIFRLMGSDMRALAVKPLGKENGVYGYLIEVA